MIDISLTPLLLGPKPATLQGKVMQEVDGANPIPAVGATVTIQETGAHSDVDVAGNFIISGLTGGSYQVRIQKLGGFHDLVPTRPITLVPLETTTLDDVTMLLDRGNIVGTVSTGTTPVAGARVEVVGTNYVALVSPDPADPTKGGFQIANIPIGPWTVTARKDQFSNASAMVTVTSGTTQNAGALTLARLLGDFLIDDADPSNTSGYTRTPGVTLNFAGFPPTGITGYRASEDPSFASFDGGFLPYSGKLQPFTLAVGEGAHTVYAQYDVSGQSSQAFSSTIVLDTIAPELPAVSFDATGTAGANRYTNHSQNLTLDVLSSDGAGSGISLMRVGDVLVGNDVSHATEPYKLNAVLTRSNVVDGPQNVYVQVIDFAGNVSDAGSDVIIVDTVAPTGSITLANGPKATDPGYTNTTLVTVNQTWNDATDAGTPTDGGVVLIKLANTSADLNAALYQPTSPSSGWFLDPIGEVPKTVWAKFRDAAGNETLTAASASITYDITPPTPASISIIGATTTSNPLVTVNLVTNPADLSTTQAFTLSDESTFTSSSTVGPSALPGTSQSPFTFSAGDGVRTVYARFRDKAGNDSITSTQVTLDTVLPSGSFTLSGTLADSTPSSTLISNNQVTVSLVPGGATEYRLGDSTMSSCPPTGYTAITTSTLTNQTLPAGGVVTLCLRDAAKNTQGPLTQSMTFDNTAPSGCAFAVAGKKLDGSAAPAGLTALTALTATIGSCGETPTEIFVSTSAVTCAHSLAWQPYSAGTAVNFASGDGPKGVFGCVRDAARNFNSIGTGSITLDTAGPTPPTATLVGSALTNGATATVNLVASDPSGLGTADAVTASEDPFFNAAGTVGPIAFPAGNQVTVNLSAGDGDKTIYVRFRDRLQNATFANVSVTRDVSPPSASIEIEGNLADGTPSQATAAPYLTSPPTVKVYLSAGSGASQYAFVPTAATACASASYNALVSTTLSTTLVVAGALGNAYLCLKDAAGNVTPSALTDVIDYLSAPPSGCTLSLAGLMADGVTSAPAGQTAKPVISATVGGCSVTATELYLASGAVSCSAFVSASYVTYTGPTTVQSFLLSAEGANTVSGCVRDAAHNVFTLAPKAINLDSTPPAALGLSINSDDTYFNASQLTGGLITVSVDGQATGATQWALAEPPTVPSSFVAFTGAPVPFTFPAEGNRTLVALFRDALGNVSSVVSDSIRVDITAPSLTGAAVAIASPTNNNYVNNNTVTVNAAYPADAVTSQLVEDLFAPVGSCTGADFAGASTTSAAGSYTFVLNATNGPKRVCLRWFDEAGNVTGPVEGTKTLDTVAPQPVTILTSARTFNPLAGSESRNQLISFVNVTDPAHATWEGLGGDAGTWFVFDAGVVPMGVPLSAPFTLAVDHGVPQGIPNILRIRESDLAGNYSSESSVVMITDIVPPQPVTLNTLWVDNSAGTALIRWQKAPSPDITGYYVYYGASPGEPGGLPDAGSVLADGGNLFADGGYIVPKGYNGFYAAEGSSPVLVGDQDYAALDSLPNGSPTYVTVRAVDHAGNIGLQPVAPAREVQMQPNDVSPNLLFDVPVLRDAGYVGGLTGTQVAIAGDFAYVMAGSNVNFSCPGTGSTVIQPFDLSTVVSPMHGGAIIPNPPGPVSYPPVLVNDEQCGAFPGAIQAEYPFLFTVSGRHFRVWSIANPRVPTPMVDVVVGGVNAHLNAVDVRGNNALVAGNGFAYHIDVSSLYDNNQATRALPIVGSQSLFALNPFSGGITWSRNKAVIGNANPNVQNNTLNLTSMVDGDGTTTFGVGLPATSLSTTQPFISQMHGNGFTSGNYSVVGEADGIHVYDQTKIFTNTSPYWDPFAVVVFPGWGQLDVIGHQAFFGEYPTGGMVSVDLSDTLNIHFSGITRALPAAGFGPRPSGFATYGNYAVQVTDASNGAPNMRMYELATPRGLRSVTSFDMASQSSLHVTPGFVTSATGMMMDLWGGLTPNLAMTTNAGSFCAYGGAVFDDTLVSTVDIGLNNGVFRLTALDNALARPGIPVDVTSNSAALITPLPATSYARGLARVGNYLLVATARSAAPTNLMLEAYRASGLRSRMPVGFVGSARTLVAGAAPGAGDKVSEYIFASSGIVPQVVIPTLRVTNNMAVVHGDGHVWVVDIAPMLDDTTLTAMAPSSVQADLTGIFPQDAVLSGNRLYVIGTPPGGSVGLLIYDATPALDGVAGTTITAANLLSSTPIAAAAAVDVRGAYALVASYSNINGGITALDVRSPGQPRIISYLPAPIGSIGLSCTSSHPTITFQGSRAYVGYKERFDILELE